jgi:hypothetical protein
VLLALSDEGASSYDQRNAAALADLGVPAFACTPDRFGPLMAAAIERRDLSPFAAQPRTRTGSAAHSVRSGAGHLDVQSCFPRRVSEAFVVGDERRRPDAQGCCEVDGAQ